MLIFKVIWRSS